MSEATLELARAAVASPHWRWMPGMAWAVHPGSALGDVYPNGGRHPVPECVVPLPDLTDPVTVEAVGILAREAWDADAIDVRSDIAPRMDGWVAWWTARELHMHWLGSGTVRCVDVDVRVACYVDALLAAPPREVSQ
jgi:hypothetical protein